jgi:hypothetical protein
MTWIRTTLLPTLIASVTLMATGCGDNNGSPVGVSTSTIVTHTVTVQNADYNFGTGKGFVDLYDGMVYTYDAVSADSNKAEKIDFRHQYRGVDIGNRRIFENMTNQNRWGPLPGTPTDSRIAPTTLTGLDFQLIHSKSELLDSFDFTGSMTDSQYLNDTDDTPYAVVFAFIDKNGKRGLFRVVNADVAPIDSRPQGKLTIAVKMEP